MLRRHGHRGRYGEARKRHDNVPDDPELAYVDLVVITLVVDDGDATQTYRTQVDLRNRS